MDVERCFLSRTKEAKTSGFLSPLQTWSDERDCRDSASCQFKKPSTLDLKYKEVADLCGSHDVIMESFEREHQPNCVVERAVQTVGGMIRTHKVALD